MTAQLSAVTGLGVATVAAQIPASVFACILAGQVIVGFSVSTTVTLNEQVAVPQILVAVTVTVVSPTLNNEPLPLPLPLPDVAPLSV